MRRKPKLVLQVPHLQDLIVFIENKKIMVNFLFNGVVVEAVFDTASPVSILSEQKAAELGLSATKKSKKKLFAAQDGELIVLGSVTTTILVNNIPITQKFIIIKNISVGCILGVSYMQHFRCIRISHKKTKYAVKKRTITAIS